MDFSKHRGSSRLHFGHKWFMHFVCASGFSKLCFATYFLDEANLRTWHISMIFLSWEMPRSFRKFCPHV
jgi:hypothetical protein